MGNCFVTKLKENVQNDELLKVGEARMVLKAGTRFRIASITGVTLVAETGGPFYNEDGTVVVGTSIVSDSTNYTSSYKVLVDTRVSILNKYNAKEVEIWPTQSETIDIEDLSNQLKYSNIIRFNVWDGANVAGNINNFISNLKDSIESIILYRCGNLTGNNENITLCSKITELSFRDTHVNTTISINNLGALTHLATLDMFAPYYDGSIEGFVQVARAAGRTTGSIIFSNYSTDESPYVTFNSERIASKSDVTLSWTASTITLDGVTINA